MRGQAKAFGTFPQPGGKQPMVWAIEGDFDPESFSSNSFAMIWPPGSGQTRRFPEADRGAWFNRKDAMLCISAGQRPILDLFFQKLRPAKTPFRKPWSKASSCGPTPPE